MFSLSDIVPRLQSALERQCRCQEREDSLLVRMEVLVEIVVDIPDFGFPESESSTNELHWNPRGMDIGKRVVKAD